MKRMMSVMAIALLVAGTSVYACDSCGCKPEKKKAECSAKKECAEGCKKECCTKKSECKKKAECGKKAECKK